MDSLGRFNKLGEAEAREALLRCCGSRRWVEAMLAERPFADREALIERAGKAFLALDRTDLLEAFSQHPKIGDLRSLKAKFAGTRAWAKDEQAGAAQADERVLASLAEANEAYERKFGYIFIICATGRSAAEMLRELLRRMGQDPETELQTAALEQAKITRLRLEKLLKDY